MFILGIRTNLELLDLVEITNRYPDAIVSAIAGFIEVDFKHTPMSYYTVIGKNTFSLSAA